MSTAVDSLLKKYNKTLTLASQVKPKSLYSLGTLSLNMAVGNVEGVPGGKIIMLLGKQSSGKSTLAMEGIAAYQRSHPEEQALYIDFERSIDPLYARNMGIDLDRLIVVREDTTEDGLDRCEEFIHAGIKYVVIDSVAAANPKSELDKGYGDSPKMASNAGLMTRFCNRIVPLIDNKDAILVLINQYRKNFSQMSRETEIPWGSLALQYTTSVIISLARIATEGKEQTVQAIIKKNKVGSPQTRTDFVIQYGSGIDHALDILTIALNSGIIQRSGAWYEFNGHKAQGMEKAKSTFPIDELQSLVIQAFNSGDIRFKSSKE